jgi:transposase-like protein
MKCEECGSENVSYYKKETTGGGAYICEDCDWMLEV